MSGVWYPEGQEGGIAALRRVALAATDDSGTQQKMKLSGLKSEQLDEIVRIHNFGDSDNPPAGSEGMLLSLGGRSDRAMVIGVEHKDSRPKNLPVGAKAIYDANGKILKFLPDSTDWDCGGKDVVLHNAKSVTIKGSDTVAIGIDGGRYVRVTAGRVDLGVSDPGAQAPFAVLTTGGASSVVFAVV